jgi:carboxyl-terminal processing protease
LLSSCASFDPHNLIARHLPPVSATGAEDGVTLSSATRRAAVDAVWKTINERYYRADLNGVDWAAARKRWEPEAMAAPTDDEFWERLDLMVAELADAHTRVESLNQVTRRKAQQSLSLGMGLRELDGEVVVTSVHPESDAYWAGVRTGMRLQTIAERAAIRQWRQWRASARKTSSPQAALRMPTRKLNDAAIAAAQAHSSEGISLEFSRADGTSFSARLRPVALSTKASVSKRMLPSGIGYIRLTAFSESVRSDLLDAVTALKDAPALILDLRGNGGGSGAMAEALVGSFVKKKTVIARTETRTGQPVTLAFGAIKIISLERSVPGRDDAYDGKVAVLIDNDSASASEGTAAALQSIGRAVVVGEVSCGCLLGYLGYTTLPGGGELAFSEIGFVTTKGNRIEGTGVVPDVVVTRTRADFAAQRDRTLESAQATLLAQ